MAHPICRTDRPYPASRIPQLLLNNPLKRLLSVRNGATGSPFLLNRLGMAVSVNPKLYPGTKIEKRVEKNKQLSLFVFRKNKGKRASLAGGADKMNLNPLLVCILFGQHEPHPGSPFILGAPHRTHTH